MITTDLEGMVEDAAAHLYVWALKDIPQDLRDALADAAERETSVTGQRVLSTILKNVQIADSDENLVCQDTGIAVYTCRVGEQFPLHPARIYVALKAGTERATIEHPLRSNAVHTITRENTGPNTGYRLPIVHWEFIPEWDGLDVKCVPKGSGSENMSFLKMCIPADGVKGIKQFVLESIVGAGGKPCPPGIVGVGIGGSADYAMYLAKEAIARPIGTRNQDPIVAQLEDELYGLLNADGEEFTDSLGPRDAVSQAIVEEVGNGNGVETPDGRPAVYLDTTRIPERDADVSLPYMLRRYRAGGIDPLCERILTYPVLHYQNGGLVIDANSETTVEGLYACGEIAGGTHGRNRMMGNSLLECTVFGRRAGRAATEKARS